jgi:predicted lipoprotein with Yx(FWY)xxD motif
MPVEAGQLNEREVNDSGGGYVLVVATTCQERRAEMGKRWLVPASLAVAALVAAGCGSSGGSGTSPTTGAGGGATNSGAPASTSSALKTAKIGGVTVLTNSKGFTLYWFVPDTSTKSNCNGSCASFWPPVPGPAKAGSGVTGKLATITRSDGSTQATYNGHPVYTYSGDSGPGQNNGNGINSSGGIWHEVTVTGAAPASHSSSSSSGGGGYGY